MPLEFPDGTTPVCNRFYVYSSSGSKTEDQLIHGFAPEKAAWEEIPAPLFPTDKLTLSGYSEYRGQEYTLESVTVLVFICACWLRSSLAFIQSR